MTPLMRQIDDRRRAQRITLAVVAAQLGTNESTLSSWSSGRNSPLFHRAVAYAGITNTRIVVPYQGRIFAEGMDIVEALPRLRRLVGVTYRDMAARVTFHPKTLKKLRTRPGPRYLSTVETYAAGLGLSLALLPAAELAVAS
ncbi:helix-turn-helix transcriptional regulator [Streptosporangium canum]|uniref:helix-turn-helix domain-containing protein n=1 Tax=Streptosporangium canum TaxID=324952 RepID=UPI0034175E7D